MERSPAKVGDDIQAMFGEIATRYDFLNRLLSFGLDQYWRKRLIRALALHPTEHVLDACCGTGDLALGLARRGVTVTGIDFSRPMLPLALKKSTSLKLDVRFLQADIQQLPFSDASFDAVTIAFGIRNVQDVRCALSECFRVLRPNGKIAILEFFPMRRSLWRIFFRFYFYCIVPLIAKIVRLSRSDAYHYLPSSVDAFVSTEILASWMKEAGFECVCATSMTGGVAHLITGEKI